MNPYFALSAIFALGLRGIEKKLELNVVPVTQMTEDDKRSGKVRSPPRRWFDRRVSRCSGFRLGRLRCCLSHSKLRRFV
jgi:hypothetical protein